MTVAQIGVTYLQAREHRRLMATTAIWEQAKKDSTESHREHSPADTTSCCQKNRFSVVLSHAIYRYVLEHTRRLHAYIS